MGLEKELELRKGRSEGLRPCISLLSHQQCSDVGKRSSKGKPTRKDDILSLKEDSKEISFGRYRSSSCKNIPPRPDGVEGHIEMKRGSIYQSSREVNKMKKRVSLEGGRRRSAMPRSSDSTFSFRFVESDTVQKNQSNRSLLLTQSSDSKTASVSKSCSSDDYFEICLDSNNREKFSPQSIGEAPLKGTAPRSRATSFPLHKSLSAKVGMPQLPSLSEGDHSSSRTSSKTRFSPIRKIFDPFIKSKSMRSPVTDKMEACKVKDSKKNKTSWKHLLDDISKPPNVEIDSLVAGSPVHLHGCLKSENKEGMPFFEFSLKCPEEVLVAKAWKADNAFNWAYTFHSVDSTKKSNASAWGSNDNNKESSMLGQMQVSCYVCSELRHDGALDNSVATECVLYDTTRARTSVAQDFAPDINAKESGRSKPCAAKVSPQTKQVLDNIETASSYLLPNLEIAAIVIQVPLEKIESLKHKRGDKISETLLKLPKTEQKGTIPILGSTSQGKVKVVIPSGNHGLRSDESKCASSLLDRWRLGGRCDCGGWDMACPLIVFSNPEDHLSMEDQHSLELFVQGSKEGTPALTLTLVEEGEYAVDFHAQLSTVQAFSICVAMLHSTGARTCTGLEKSMQLPQCSSLKMLLEEEVKFLIDAATEEDKRKVTKTRKEIPASFMLNPPFCPNIARV